MVFEKIREIIASQLGKDEDEITLETNVRTISTLILWTYSRSSMILRMSLRYLSRIRSQLLP